MGMGSIFGRKRFGLVFGGGGIRGGAHVGAWRVLHEIGFRPDLVVGASIGALVAGALGKGMSPDEMEEMFRLGSPILLDTSCNDGRGRTRTERLAFLLNEIFGDADLRDLHPRTAVMATDLRGHDRILIERGPAAKAIQASMSIPGVFDPVPWGDLLLVDGGVLDNVPTQAAYQLGADRLVAIDIGGDDWDLDSAFNTVGCVNKQLQRAMDWMVKVSRRETMLDTWIRSAMMPASKLSQIYLAACPPDVLIHPQMDNVWLLSMEKVSDTFAAGEYAAQQVAGEVRRLITRRRTPRKEVPKFLPALLTL